MQKLFPQTKKLQEKRSKHRNQIVKILQSQTNTDIINFYLENSNKKIHRTVRA